MHKTIYSLFTLSTLLLAQYNPSTAVFPSHQISQSIFTGNFSPETTADIDNDGDVDILGHSDKQYFWLENRGSNTFHIHHLDVSKPDSYTVLKPVETADGTALLQVVRNDYSGRVKYSTLYTNDGNNQFVPQNEGMDQPATQHDSIDVDMDGDYDIFTGSTGSYSSFIRLSEQIAEGSYNETKVNVDRFNRLRSYRGVDLNNDGFTDVVSVSEDSVSLQIHINDKNNSFITQKIHVGGTDTYNKFLTADFSGNGHLDILAFNTYMTDDNSPVLFENDGSESFTSRTNISIPQLVTPVNWLSKRQYAHASVEYNNDSLIDFVAIVNGGDKLLLIKNNGDQTYTSKLLLDNDDRVTDMSFIKALDCNNDGQNDIVIVARTGVYWLENRGDSTAVKHLITESIRGEEYGDLEVADFNGDTFIDLVISSNYDNKDARDAVFIHSNNGDGTFTKIPLRDQNKSANIYNPSKIILCDLNRDGRMDITVQNQHRNTSTNVRVGRIQFYTNLGDNRFDWSKTVLSETGYEIKEYTLVNITHKDSIDVVMYTKKIFDQYPFTTNLQYVSDTGLVLIEEGRSYFSLESADLNGDGLLELITLTRSGVLCYNYDSNKSFTSYTICGGAGSYHLARSGALFVDLDGDSDIDITGTNSFGELSWFENRLSENITFENNVNVLHPSAGDTLFAGDTVEISWSGAVLDDDLVWYLWKVGDTTYSKRGSARLNLTHKKYNTGKKTWVVPTFHNQDVYLQTYSSFDSSGQRTYGTENTSAIFTIMVRDGVSKDSTFYNWKDTSSLSDTITLVNEAVIEKTSVIEYSHQRTIIKTDSVAGTVAYYTGIDTVFAPVTEELLSFTIDTLSSGITSIVVIENNNETSSLNVSPNPAMRNDSEMVIELPQSLPIDHGKLVIFDALGNAVETMFFHSAEEGAFSWDLLDPNGDRVSSGSYILIMEYQLINGEVKVFRKQLGVQR